MLKIRVELWPKGSEKDSKIIASGLIINDGSGSVEVGNYNFEFVDDFGKLASGRIEGHVRGNQVWKLIYLALKKVFEEDI